MPVGLLKNPPLQLHGCAGVRPAATVSCQRGRDLFHHEDGAGGFINNALPLIGDEVKFREA